MKDSLKEALSKVNALQFLIINTMLMAFLLSVYVLLFKDIPINNRDAVMVLIGMITGSLKTMVDYYYGSSKSSAKKTETIDAMIKDKDDANNN